MRPHDEALRRLDVWEPHIHAFAALCPQTQCPSSGSLAGLTVGVKDIIDVAGVPTRNGSLSCADAAPAVRDAAVVAALRAAGACIVGKTTTTEFAFTDPTPCRNPHDLDRSPGGSSSGSGAAVAAGVVDVALGTQTAGSLCRPAAYCGVVGYKPSAGVLPGTGVTPLAPSFDTVGIIARSVPVAEATLAVMAPDLDATPAPAVLRCGVWDDGATPASGALTALGEATDALDCASDHGIPSAPVTAIVSAHRTVMVAEAAKAHAERLSRTELLQPNFARALQEGLTVTPAELSAARQLLATETAAFWDRLDAVEAVLTLPVPQTAPLMDGTTGFQHWLTPWTVFGGPLVSVPWGVDEQGLPRAVMLAGRPGEDKGLLALAAALHARAPVLPEPLLPAPGSGKA